MNIKMVLEPSFTLAFIQSHGYFIMFLAMLVEGPITTYIGSFAASLGLFNIFIVFILAVLANVLGDIVLYSIGKFTRTAFRKKYKKYFDNKKLVSHLKKHTGKTLFIIKLIPPLPAPGLILAGALNVSFRKFLFLSFIISFPLALIFALFGFYSGIAFNLLLNYLQIWGIVILVIGLLFMAWLIFFKIPKYLAKKYENIN